MTRRECFGILERVFPLGESGLREVPAECFQCPDRTECLRAAMRTRDGIRMQEETVNRAAKSGMMSRIQRWSQKKALHRQAQERKKEKSS